MKECANIAELLDLDFVERSVYGSVLELHKDGIIVKFTAETPVLCRTSDGSKFLRPGPPKIIIEIDKK